jgi:hypothetical protein
MVEEEDVLWYYRCFILLSKPLLDSLQLTKEEQNTAFWYGFHLDNRREMSSHLFGQHLKQPKGRAFDYEDVFDMAQVVFTGEASFPSQWQDHWEEPAG